MHKLLAVALAVLLQGPAWAQTASPALTGPTEVGTTTMAVGQYQVTDKTTGKVYDLMITGKGNMILSPSASAASVPSAVPAIVAAPVAAPVAAVTAAPTTVPGAVPAAAGGVSHGESSPINSLVNQGMQRGLNELMKRGATNQLKNLVK